MHKLKICTYSVFALSLFLTVLRTLCLLFCFDETVGYFDSSLPVLTGSILTFLATLWCFSPLVLFQKEAVTAEKNAARRSDIFAVITSALFGLSGLLLFIFSFQAIGIIGSFCGIFLMAGSVYPWLRLSHHRNQTATVMTGLGLVLGFLFILLSAHFDMYVTANSPLKNAIFAGVICCALFLLADIRMLFEDGMPRLRLSLQLLSLILCLPTAVGGTVFYFATELPSLQKNTLSPVWLLPFLAIVLYSVTQLLVPTDDPSAPSQRKRK